MTLFTKWKQTPRRCKRKLMVTKGEGWRGGGDREPGAGIGTLMEVKWMVHRDPLFSTGKATHCAVIAYGGKESEKE